MPINNRGLRTLQDGGPGRLANFSACTINRPQSAPKRFAHSSDHRNDSSGAPERPTHQALKLLINTLRSSNNSLFALVCLDCCCYPIK